MSVEAHHCDLVEELEIDVDGALVTSKDDSSDDSVAQGAAAQLKRAAGRSR